VLYIHQLYQADYYSMEEFGLSLIVWELQPLHIRNFRMALTKLYDEAPIYKESLRRNMPRYNATKYYIPF
jgi:hypothetical protein